MQTFINDYRKALTSMPGWGRIAVIVVTFLVFISGILNIVWQTNNPKANQMTFWTHFGDVIQLKKLDRFQ